VPYEIKFSGTTLWNQMMRGGSFDVPMCDAIMRLFKSLDDQMYEAGHNGWSGIILKHLSFLFVLL